MRTQTGDILEHLKLGKHLTQREAVNEYKAYRLSGKIHSLRKQGHNIQSIPFKVCTGYKKKDGNWKMVEIVKYIYYPPKNKS